MAPTLVRHALTPTEVQQQIRGEHTGDLLHRLRALALEKVEFDDCERAQLVAHLEELRRAATVALRDLDRP